MRPQAAGVVVIGQPQGAGETVDIESPGQGDAMPAVFAQPRHDATGERALADAPDALQHHPGALAVAVLGGRSVAQDGQRCAHLPAPTDQLAELEPW
jgi:hypothetical protein